MTLDFEAKPPRLRTIVLNLRRPTIYLHERYSENIKIKQSCSAYTSYRFLNLVCTGNLKCYRKCVCLA